MNRVEHVNPLPGPQTRALAASGVRELLYGGARGGGKTFVGILWIMRPAVENGGNPKYRGLVIRRNFVDLCDWIGRARDMFSSFGARLSGNDFVFPCGAVVRVGHLADSNAFEKYQGHEYHQVLVEELTQIPAEIDYLKLASSCRSTVPELSPRIFAPANPGGPGHSWVKNRFRCTQKPGKAFRDDQGQVRLFIPAKLADNPHLDKTDYRKTLEALPDQLRRAWLDGDWDTLSGQFFTEFNRTIHVIEERPIPKYWKRYTAMDWGYRPDPWVCLWFAVDESGHEYLYRETHGNEMTPEEVAKRIRDLNNDEIIVGRVADPSMWASKDSATSTADKLSRAGWWVTQADNDRENGAMRIREYLRLNPATGRPWLQIFSGCLRTIEALSSVTHDEKDPMKIGDHPLDHWVDPIRYHLMERPTRARLPERGPPEGSIEFMEIREKNKNG